MRERRNTSAMHIMPYNRDHRDVYQPLYSLLSSLPLPSLSLLFPFQPFRPSPVHTPPSSYLSVCLSVCIVSFYLSVCPSIHRSIYILFYLQLAGHSSHSLFAPAAVSMRSGSASRSESETPSRPPWPRPSRPRPLSCPSPTMKRTMQVPETPVACPSRTSSSSSSKTSSCLALIPRACQVLPTRSRG